MFLSADSDDSDGSAEASFPVRNYEHEVLVLLQIQRDVVRFRCLLWTGKVMIPVCLEGCTDLIKTHLLHSMKDFQVSYCVNNAMFLQFDQRHGHEIRMKQKGTMDELECGQERVIYTLEVVVDICIAFGMKIAVDLFSISCTSSNAMIN